MTRAAAAAAGGGYAALAVHLDPALLALDLVALVGWSTGLFLGALVTALPRYHAGWWWLWPAVRVGWQVPGGAVAGAATAHLVGAPARGLVVGAAVCGLLGLVVATNAARALLAGVRAAQGRLLAVRSEARMAWLPQAPAAKVYTVWGRLETAQGEVELRFRGAQAQRARAALEALRPGATVRVLHLPALGAFIGAAEVEA